jgi:hypothetical protein
MPLVEPSTARRETRYRPRQERDGERMRRALLTATAQAQPAFAVALVQIETAFDGAAAINEFKLRVERILRLGPQHPAIRARFAARATPLCGRGLDGATILVERWWRDERKAFAIASAFGRGSRLSLDALSELRLILRLARFKRYLADYDAALAALRGGEAPIMQAAE